MSRFIGMAYGNPGDNAIIFDLHENFLVVISSD